MKCFVSFKLRISNQSIAFRTSKLQLTVSHETAKIATDNAMPGCTLFGVELKLISNWP